MTQDYVREPGPIDQHGSFTVTLSGRDWLTICATLSAGGAQLNVARASVVRLVTAMIDGAQKKSFHVMHEFFLNEALFKLRPLHPFTD